MPNPVQVRWFGARVRKEVEKESARNVQIAARFLQREIKDVLNVGGGKANVSRTGRRRGRGGTPPRRSKPGQAPFKQTGRLQRSIFARKIDRFIWEVGTNLVYGVGHELGIRYSSAAKGTRVEQRPFIRPTFAKNKKKLKRILATGIVDGQKPGRPPKSRTRRTVL